MVLIDRCHEFHVRYEHNSMVFVVGRLLVGWRLREFGIEPQAASGYVRARVDV